jgi:CheY-like chemotaxis protein
MTALINSAVGSSITITQRLDATIGPALVDPTQVELVLLNLVINARDAMPAGGDILITTGLTTTTAAPAYEDLHPGSYIQINVSDTGTGMSEGTLARAFEPFFTTKAPGVGTGLGLSQVHGVVHQLGGLARIESAPGRGTTVMILLPRAPAAEPNCNRCSPSDMPAAATQSGRCRLLVVDDDGDVRATTTAMLHHLGYHVTEANGAEQALAILSHGDKIDLMLTDVVMPGQSGTDLANQTRRTHPGLPVVFVSGYADTGTIAGVIPPDRLLRKPFRSSELTAIIQRTLAEA